MEADGSGHSEAAPVPLAITRIVEAAIAASTDADVDAIDRALAALEADGLLDQAELAIAEALADGQASGSVPPGLHLALSAVYGRKGLEAKAYSAIEAAETAAQAPGVRFSLAAIHGRKALLAPVSGSFSLSVRCPVPGATVSVDGSPPQAAPARFAALRPGRHEIVVSHPWYEPLREIVDGSDGAAIELDAELSLLPVGLTLDSDPRGAAVSANGAYLGMTPWEGSLQPGDYRLDFVAEPYEPAMATVLLEPGSEPMSLLQEMSFGSASIAFVGGPDGLPIIVNDLAVGILPLTLRDLPAGEYRVSSDYYRAPDGSVYDNAELGVIELGIGESVALPVGIDGSMTILYAPSGGYPDGAVVSVDGKRLGAVPLGPVELPVGQHQVKVVLGLTTLLDASVIFLSGETKLAPASVIKPAYSGTPLPALSPKIDGAADDWIGVAPFLDASDPSSWSQANQGNVTGIYLACDAESVYCLVESADGRASGLSYQLQFYNSVDPGGKRNGALSATYNGGQDRGFSLIREDWDKRSSGTITKGFSGRSSERYLEFKIPKSAIGCDFVALQLNLYRGKARISSTIELTVDLR
ncbi:MAG TPA: PEGA domain-containing protein [Spirochaetia bacterium]|nr:PEGA domain-containing protein [Spirochaetia bacterium]